MERERVNLQAVVLAADKGKRQIAATAVTYGEQTGDWRKLSIGAGSLSLAEHLPVLFGHDPGRIVGSVSASQDSADALKVTLSIANTPAGDEALTLAAEGHLRGVSVGLDVTETSYNVETDATTILAATVREVSLTGFPALPSSQIPDVSLSQAPATAPAAPATTEGDITLDSNEIRSIIREELADAAPAAPAAVPPTASLSVREAPVYTFSGHGHSLVRDTFNARANGDTEAAERLRRFEAQQREMATFATVNRTGGVSIIPPSYQAGQYLPQLLQGRPLLDMCSKGSLVDATPFTIPRFGSATGATADHVEGTNPSDGTLTFSSQVTVTPGAISGRFRITREMVDAANPAVDQIALNALRESYAQQTEGKVYTLLNGAAGVGGTITSGYVPSGAAVVAASGVGSTGAAGTTLLGALRQQMVEYPFRRFARPDRLALSAEGAVALAKAVDSTGRPMLPRLGATNASGEGNALQGSFDVDGLAGTPAWSMTGNAAGDADTILFNSQDVWVWGSSLLAFRYEEVAGPANIDLVIFGYFATQVLRGAGLSAIRLTVS